jgi:hypothetical protein
MDRSQLIDSSEAATSHNIKNPLGLAPLVPAPGLKICRDIRGGLVLFLQSPQTNAATRGRRFLKKRTIDNQPPKAMVTVARNRYGFHVVKILPNGSQWTWECMATSSIWINQFQFECRAFPTECKSSRPSNLICEQGIGYSNMEPLAEGADRKKQAVMNRVVPSDFPGIAQINWMFDKPYQNLAVIEDPKLLNL